MSSPIPGPPCTLPQPSIVGQVYNPDWIDAAVADGSAILCNGCPRPSVKVLDNLKGRLIDPVALGGGLAPVWGWLLGDLCYGMTYRSIIAESMLDDPVTSAELRRTLSPGSCCYTEIMLRGDADADDWNFPYSALPSVHYDTCWNYDSHSDPACQRMNGIPCCSSTHGGGWNPETGVFDLDWELTDRAGPSRFSCENWTTDGQWVSGLTCLEEWYEGAGMCSTACDGTPWACCGCGQICSELSFADCQNVRGAMRRGEPCGSSSCDDAIRECDVGHWAMVLRPDEHYPTKDDYNGNRPLMQPGDHAPMAISNPSQRFSDGGPVTLEPTCRAHYGAVRVNSEGDFAVTICGNHQAVEPGADRVDFAHPDLNMRAFRSDARTRPDGDVVWPVSYRPACGEPSTDWSWND